MSSLRGRIVRVSGPAVVADGMSGARLNDVVRVGPLGLLGEVIRLDRDTAFIQVYEDTTGLSVNDEVEGTSSPLCAELGPGVMGQVFDGIQRPLSKLEDLSGHFISRGLTVTAVDKEALWEFEPLVSPGSLVEGGVVLGRIQETDSIEHRVMTPPGVSGTVKEVRKGKLSAAEVVTILEDGTELTMIQRWPVKKPRPVKRRLDPDTLFLTGQRVLDTLFPVALGGNVIIPGGFGTGKTVVEQTLARYSCADCIVYVGCGERGNEMAELLTEFPHLVDPRTGKSIMGRTVLIANTSNMPVAAREASIYTGVTIAEFYRDMGYDVALMADSTSRWAEALREISSRLGELPGEEGYPTYLATRLAQFYERAGRVDVLGGADVQGSVTIVGAVSPAGGDFSEPVTQSSMRVSGAVWSLDSTLAYRRHYPSVNWVKSFTKYDSLLADWFLENAPPGWMEARNEVTRIMAREAQLQEIVQLVGMDSLQSADRMLLETGRMIREVYLQQNSFDPADAFCPIEKQFGLLMMILDFNRMGIDALNEGAEIGDIIALNLRDKISALKTVDADSFSPAEKTCRAAMVDVFGHLDRIAATVPVIRDQSDSDDDGSEDKAT